MEKIIKEWRKATPEEIAQGSTEMILVSEKTIEVPDEVKEKIKLDNIDIDSMTSEDLDKLAQKLKPFLK